MVAEKIRTTLAAAYHLNVTPTGQAITMVEHLGSASIGVGMFVNHEVGKAEILKRADMAMYQAKEAGRNLVRIDGEDKGSV